MANDIRLIDANDMRKNWLENGVNEYVYDTNAVLDSIDNQPTIEALPLRCHMGDTVWIVGTKCMSGLYEEECDTYIHYGECECHLDKEYTVFQRKVNGVMFLYLHDLDKNELLRWGETVFKTQEEAETALAKMKEADHEPDELI